MITKKKSNTPLVKTSENDYNAAKYVKEEQP